jgi:CRISPR-associated protein Cas5t
MHTLYLECPITSFPRSYARDYKETYLYPPFSTVYGCLLSLVGEENKLAHLGVKLATGIVGDIPPVSRLLRKQTNHGRKFDNQGNCSLSQFSKPNLQEILTDVKVVVKIDSTNESASIKLEERVAIALSTPEKITRYGGLSLGESWALVNGIRPYRLTDGKVRWLVKDNRGFINLPTWIDYSLSQSTFQSYTLSESEEFNEQSWTDIQFCKH